MYSIIMMKHEYHNLVYSNVFLARSQPVRTIEVGLYALQCLLHAITVDVIHTCTLILLLIRNTIALVDSLSEYAGTGKLQRVCCQAAKKETKLGVEISCKNEPQVGMGL